MPICIHCDIYNKVRESQRKTVKISEKVKIHNRYCLRVEKDRQPEDESCKDFIPNPTFLCDKFKYRLHLLQCLHRQKMKMEDCKKCLQAEDIIDVARGKDLYEYFGVDRKLHMPRKKPKKPKLLRRKG